MAKLKSAAKRKPGSDKSTEGLQRSIMDSAQQIWLAGMGAFGRAQEEGTKLFESLVKEGSSLEHKTRKLATGKVDAVRDAVENRVGAVKERAADTWDRLEKVFEDRVQRALTRLGVPGREDLQDLIKRVDDLPPNDRRRRHPRFEPENLARNVKPVEELEAMARGQGVTAAQLALAWLLAQGEDIVPIPGTNHVHNVELNAAAADIRLSPEKVARLGEIFAIGAGAGKRYGERLLRGMGI